MSNIKKTLTNNVYMLSIVFKVIPFYVLISILIVFLQSIVAIVGDVVLTKYVMDSVQYNRSFGDIIIFISGVAVLFIITQIFSAVFGDIYAPIMRERLSKHMQNMVFDKSVHLNLRYYDDPQYYDLFVVSQANADSRALEVFDTLVQFLSLIFTILGVGSLITVIDPICAFFVLVSTILSLVINLKKSRVDYNQDIESKAIKRRQDYIHRVFYLKDFAKEIRITKVKNILLKKYRRHMREMSGCIQKYAKINFCYTFLNGFIVNTFIVDILYFSVLVIRAAVTKKISYGTIAGMINAAWSLNNAFSGMKNVLPKLSLHSKYIGEFKRFMELESTAVNENCHNKVNSLETLEIKNGYFQYPGNKEHSLTNINFVLKRNSKVAIVGQNGAGKTTLLKILLQLYELNSGELLINGRNIKEYNMDEYRKKIGIVFQDFKLFATKISENIRMDIVNDNEKKQVWEAIQKAVVDGEIDKTQLNLDSFYTKEFSDDGIYLSGGQRQTLAIARMFIKESPLFIILDEASSALDPFVESKINERLLDYAKDKAMVFISHRLSVTQYVDNIYVMDDGKIIEAGNHMQLMEKKGKYYQMFKVQAEKYSLD